MPCPSLPLYDLKDQIQVWFCEELRTIEDIATLVSKQLGKPCTSRTIKRRLQEWNFTRRNIIQETLELRLRITILFQ